MRTQQAIVPAGAKRGETFLRSRVVDIRKTFAVSNFFLQVAEEQPRACLNGMSWSPAVSNKAVRSGSRHLILMESLVRDLKEIFVGSQTAVLSFS